jgi:uncharacterized protein YwgA
MKDYWLAKLISSVTEVDSRKRLQKSIYLLQKSGSPLHFSYILHYYGPYSFELAGLIDQLHAVKIIEETQEGPAYKSRITTKGMKVIENFEQTETGIEAKNALSDFIPKFVELNKKDLWPLELAATISYFHRDDWSEAVKQTAAFKKVSLNDEKLKLATELSRSFKLA